MSIPSVITTAMEKGTVTECLSFLKLRRCGHDSHETCSRNANAAINLPTCKPKTPVQCQSAKYMLE